MAEWTRMHGPGDSAPVTSETVARCKVCGTSWQVRGASENELGCSFCDAPADAVVVVSEAPGYDGRVVSG